MTTTIVTRSGKGSPLTNTELDANFTNLKTTADAALPAAGGTISGSLIITSDLEVRGTTTSIDSTTVEITDLNITLAKDATNATQANGAGITIAGSNAELKYVSTGDNWTINKNLSLGDNIKAQFGNDSTFKIYRAGGNSFIDEQGSGNLRIRGSDITIQDAQGNGFISMIDGGTGGTVFLKHNGSDVLQTTSTGIDVTGTISSGAISANAGTTNTVATFTSTDAGAGINLTDNSGTSTIQTNGANLRIGVDEDGAVSSSAIQFRVDGSTKATLDSSGTLIIKSGNKLQANRADNSRNVQLFCDNNFGTIETSTDPIKIASQVYTRFDTSGTERMRLTSTGLGIGVTSPSSFDSEANNLVVGDGSGDNGITIFTGSNVGDHGSIFFGDATSTPKQGQIRYEQNNEVMSFFTNTSERMRLDLSGNLLVGKTAAGTTNTAGHELKESGIVVHTTNNTTTMYLNRKTSDGDLIEFRKDNSVVGSIGTGNSGNLYIGSGDAGINFNKDVNSVYPINVDTGGATDGTLDLGLSAYRFKDLHLSGAISSGAITSTGSSTFTSTGVMDLNLVANPPELNFEDTSSNSGTKRARLTLDSNAVALQGLNDADSAITQDFMSASLSTGNIAFNSGNVNIPNGSLMVGATTAPSSYYAFANNLVVTGDSANRAGITISGTATSMINLSDGTGLVGFIDYNHSNDSMTLGTAESNALVIDSSQNVGIGTTSPDVLLDVEGSGSTPLFLSRKQSSVGPGVGLGFRQYDSANNLHSYASIFGVIEDNTNGAEDGGLVFHTSLASALGERMRITSSGNVGVGQTVPDAFAIGGAFTYLAVGGTKPGILNLVDDSTNGSYLQFGTNAGVRRASIHAVNGSHLAFTVNASNSGTGLTEAMRIKNNGYVGIGTTSPARRLSVETSGTSIVSSFKRSDAANAFISFSDNSTTADYTVGVGAAGDTLFLRASNVEQARINNTGLGIGTISPAERLHVHQNSTSGSRIRLSNTDGYLEIGTNNQVSNLDSETHTFRNEAGSTEYMRINSSGRVGIGTTSLTADGLTIGTINNNCEFDLTHTSGKRYRLNSLANGNFQVENKTDSTTVLAINSSGNVGIGVTNPAVPLDIQSNSSAEGIRVRGRSSDNIGQITLTDSGGTARNQIQGSATYLNIKTFPSSPIVFFTGGSERMRIDSSGNFMVGKTTQGLSNAGFEVAQTGQASATQSGASCLRLNRLTSDGEILQFRKAGVTVGNIATVDGDLTIFSSASGHKGLRFGNGYIAPTANSTNIEDNAVDLGLTIARFKDLHLSNSVKNSSGALAVESGGGGQLLLKASSELTFSTNSAERMRIDSSGRVGIGTTSPSNLLDCTGSISNDYVAAFENTNATNGYGVLAKTAHTGTSAFAFGAYGGSNALMVVRGDGQVAIGTVNPNSYTNQRVLTINGTTHSRIDFETGSTLRASVYGDSGSLNIDALGNFTRFYTGNTERMRIDSSGRLGIGTTSPDQKLHVVGNAKVTGVFYADNIQTLSGTSIDFRHQDASTIMRVDTTNARVGIGTTSPTEPITVSKTSSGNIVKIASFVNPVGTANTGVQLWLSGTNTTTRGTFITAVAESTSNDHTLRFGTSAGGSAPIERLRIGSNGGVSIGTTTATGAGGLLVDNDIKTNSRFGVGSFGNTSNPAFYVLADTDTGIYFPDFNHIGFVTAGVERLQIDQAGNIGGGGNDPQYPLDLRNPSDSNQIFRVQFPDANTVQIGTSRMGSGATQNVFLEGQDGVRFGASGSEVGRFNSSGHFLVNTTSLSRDTATSGTSAHLSVSGSFPHIFTRQSSTTGSSVLLLNDTGAGGTIIELKKDGSNVGAVGTVSDNIYIGTGDTGLYFNATNDSIYPINTSTVAGRDNGVDLGKSDTRFKDAHFSGAVNITNTSGGSYFKAVQTSNVANAGLYMQSGSHNWYTLVDTSGRYQIYDGDAVAIRVMVDTSGKLLIGGTTSSASGTTSFSASGAGQINFNASSSAGQCLLLRRVNHNGNAITFENADEDEVGSITMSSNATAYNTSSDARLKDNIEDADESGNTIDAIKVRQFDWKNGKHQNHGMIAQELQKIVPEAVSGDAESEEMMGIDYSKLVPMLVKEIQSLRQRVAQLEE